MTQGHPDPCDHSEVFVLAMVVIPFEYVEPISKQWVAFVKQNLSLIDEPPVIGVEWKAQICTTFIVEYEVTVPCA